MAIHKIPDNMRVGPPVLRVRNIENVLAFYESSLGLQVNRSYKFSNSDNDTHGGDDYPIYELGFKNNNYSSPYEPHLILKHDPDAVMRPLHSERIAAGLFHFAIVVPDRKSLALTYLAVKNSGIRYDGFADHLVSESLYLRDPEDNGIEIYRDRPSNEWPRNIEGQIIMNTLPLDLDSLLAEITTEELKDNANKAFPIGARIGHIHLRVTRLERSIKFYHQKIGLDVTVDWSSMGAAFLSAGGYHHHIGMNTWFSLNGKGHLDGESGLDYFTLIIPDRPFVNSLASRMCSTNQSKQINWNQLLVSDPDGIPILIRSS